PPGRRGPPVVRPERNEDLVLPAPGQRGDRSRPVRARPRARTAEGGGVCGPGGPCPRRCEHPRPSFLLTAGRVRDTLLRTPGREESTQPVMGKRLRFVDEPWLEVAVPNPG